MKILTWNANMAFRKKQKQVFEIYDPDILVIQECENPEAIIEKIYPYFLWTGENRNKGLAVFSKFKIQELTIKDVNSKYHIPFKINNFYFIGIWAMDDKKMPENRYIGQVYNILNNYIEFFKHNIVILGDFNWNIIWDKKPNYPLSGNINDVIKLLNNFKIHSLYHSNFDERFGHEKVSTFYMYKNKEKPYHIDYIFLKDKIAYKNFQIGEYSDWISYSDHMPLFVEIF